MQGATHPRGRAGHRRSLQKRGAVTGVRTAHRRHRGRVRRQLRRHVGAPARREGRREHPAPGGRALLPHHRADPRADGSTGRCSRTRRSYGYFREEVGGLMVGLFEPVCAPWKVDGVPEDFSFGEIHARLGPHGPVRREGDARVPDLARESASASSSAGRRASRPDLQPIVGEAPELKNYFVAAGLNSIGILTGGGLGRVLAHWIINGRPDVDVTGFNIDRLHTYQANPEYRRTRTVESLGMVYHATTRRARCRPRAARRSRRPRSARGARRLLPRRQRLGRRRLVRAARASSPRSGQLSWGRQNWFPYWAGRARRRARRRDPHGHVVHGEVPRPGARRGRVPRTTSRPTTSTASRA